VPSDPFIAATGRSGVSVAPVHVGRHGTMNGSVALRGDQPPSGFKLELGKGADIESDFWNMIVSSVMRASPVVTPM
jgi:hypothetical protein